MQKKDKVKERMIVNSSFTQCSGEGTRMFSRQGKATINHYLCFNESASSRFNTIALKNYNRKLQERSKNLVNFFRFENRFVEITDEVVPQKQQKEEQPQPSLPLNTICNISNRFQVNQRSISPPTGYYKPVYSLVEKRVLTYSIGKDIKKNNKSPQARDSGDTIEPRLRNEFIRKIRLKDKLMRPQNETQEVVSLGKKGGGALSFMRRSSLKTKSPFGKDNEHFESIRCSEIQKLRPASSLGIRGRRWSRPQSPQHISPIQSGYGSTVKSAIDFTKQISRGPFVDPKKGPNQ